MDIAGKGASYSEARCSWRQATGFGPDSRLQHDPRIIVHLMPQPVGRQSAPLTEVKVTEDPKIKKRPGKRGRAPPNVPAELKDCYQRTPNGKPICWAYNLASGCKSNAGGIGGNPPACNGGMCVHFAGACPAKP